MKAVKKYVYYCDFCKKKGLRKDAIIRHEWHCTMNPKRWCRLCENTTDMSEDIQMFKSRFEISISKSNHIYSFQEGFPKIKWIGEPITMEELRIKYDNCPACILSILRQTQVNQYDINFEFEYEKESKEYFDSKNRDRSGPY